MPKASAAEQPADQRGQPEPVEPGDRGQPDEQHPVAEQDALQQEPAHGAQVGAVLAGQPGGELGPGRVAVVRGVAQHRARDLERGRAEQAGVAPGRTVDRDHHLGGQQHVVAGHAARREHDVVAQEVAVAHRRPGQPERRAGVLGVGHGQPVRDQRPGAHPGQHRRVVADGQAEVRAGLPQRAQVVADRLQEVDDERAVPEQVVEERGVAGAHDRPVAQPAHPVERVGRVGAHEPVQQPGHGEHQQQPQQHGGQHQHRGQHQVAQVEAGTAPGAGRGDARKQRGGPGQRAVAERNQQEERGRGQRRGAEQQHGQLEHRVPGAPPGAARPCVDAAEIGVRRLGRGTVPALPGRHGLAAVQGRGVPQLGPVAEAGVDVQHRPLADQRIAPDVDPAGADPAGLGPVAAEQRALADHRARADPQQVAAHRGGGAEHHGPAADLRAEQAQVTHVERGAAETGQRADPQQRLDQPEPDVAQAPDRDLGGPPASDQQPLGRHRQRRQRPEQGRAERDRPQVGVPEPGRCGQPVVPEDQDLCGQHQPGQPDPGLQQAGAQHRAERRGADGARPGVGSAGRPFDRGQPGREGARRRVLVDVLRRHRGQLGEFAQPRAQLGDQQRVHPEIGQAGCSSTETRSRPSSPATALASARSTAVSASTTVALPGDPARPARGRQVLPVGLVAGQHRHHVEPLEVGRDHVGRQPAAQLAVHRVEVHRRPGRLLGVVGHQLDHARRRLVGVDHGLGDPGQPEQHRLDLGQLDPVAADLDLGVDPAEALDQPVVGDPAQVAGAVEPARGVVRDADEVRDEGLRGEVVAVHVAGRQARPRRSRSRPARRAAARAARPRRGSPPSRWAAAPRWSPAGPGAGWSRSR